MPKTTRFDALRFDRFRWLLRFSFLACLVIARPAAAQVDLHIFTDNYPPYSIAESGKSFAHKAKDIGGLCTDIVKVLLKNSGYTYAMKIREWNFAYTWVQEHKNHGLFCTARSNERENIFQWVGPLATMRWTLFAAPDSNISLDSLDDAKALQIGGYRGGIISKYLKEKGFNVITSGIDRENPLRLLEGQIDVWATDGLTGPIIAEEQAGIRGLEPVLVFGETPFYLAISKQTDPEIVATLEASLDKAREDGTLRTIQARYGL